MEPHSEKMPMLIVRRVYFDQFLAGTKDTEYRRHRHAFNERVFYPGRRIRLGYHYNIKLVPSVIAVVVAFEVKQARHLKHQAAALLDVYPDLTADQEIAIIKLMIESTN